MDKQLKNSKTALENYAMLAMTLPMDSDGNWGIDYNKAKIIGHLCRNALENNPLNCWKPLKLIIPQRKTETNLNVMVTKVERNYEIVQG